MTYAAEKAIRAIANRPTDIVGLISPIESDRALAVRELASVIDRETGLPELIKACESALVHMAGNGKECEMCGGGRSLPYHEICACYPVRKALAKAKGKS